MKLKDILFEKDLDSDIAGLKADQAKEKAGLPEENVDDTLRVEVTFTEDDEPKVYNVGITYDEIDVYDIGITDYEDIDITDYEDIDGVDSKLLAKAMRYVKNQTILKDGIWITVYDDDCGTL